MRAAFQTPGQRNKFWKSSFKASFMLDITTDVTHSFKAWTSPDWSFDCSVFQRHVDPRKQMYKFWHGKTASIKWRLDGYWPEWTRLCLWVRASLLGGWWRFFNCTEFDAAEAAAEMPALNRSAGELKVWALREQSSDFLQLSRVIRESKVFKVGGRCKRLQGRLRDKFHEEFWIDRFCH